MPNSTWGDGLRCGPWYGQHRNNKALHESPDGPDQDLQFFPENPSRGRLHLRLLRSGAGEPAAHWRILQVSLRHPCEMSCSYNPTQVLRCIYDKMHQYDKY